MAQFEREKFNSDFEQLLKLKGKTNFKKFVIGPGLIREVAKCKI